MDLVKSEENISGQIKFGVAKRVLEYRPFKVLKLIESCVEKKILLDEYILQNWFLEEIIKPRKRMKHGKHIGQDSQGYNKYEEILEYDLRKRQIKERGGLMDGYFLQEAKVILKYHIGNLVVRGYLTVLPTINLSEEKEEKCIAL